MVQVFYINFKMILTLDHRPSNVLSGGGKSAQRSNQNKNNILRTEILEQLNFQRRVFGTTTFWERRTEQQNSWVNGCDATVRSLPRCPQNCPYPSHIFVDSISVLICICIYVYLYLWCVFVYLCMYVYVWVNIYLPK